MKILTKPLVFMLLLLLLNLYGPGKALAGPAVQKLKNSIIEYEPESSTTDEKDMPGKQGGGKWIWALLGVAAIGGVAAAAGGGGSDGGGSKDSTGSYSYSW